MAIDQNSAISLSATTLASASGSTMQVVNSMVNQLTSYKFFFLNSLYIQQGGILDVVFPNQYVLDPGNQIFNYSQDIAIITAQQTS